VDRLLLPKSGRLTLTLPPPMMDGSQREEQVH
jgi:hypothetical protein